MWDLIVSVPDHCLSFYLEAKIADCGTVYKQDSETFFNSHQIVLKVAAIIFVQLRENHKLKYALTFNVIGWANNDLDMTYCLSNEKVCYLGHYPGCLLINQWNSEKCGIIVRI